MKMHMSVGVNYVEHLKSVLLGLGAFVSPCRDLVVCVLDGVCPRFLS